MNQLSVLSLENLIQCLSSTEDRVCRWAAFQLVQHHEDACESYIEQLLSSEILDIKESGVHLVGQYGLSAFVFPVFRIFNEASNTLKRAASIALAELQYKNIEAPLWKWFERVVEDPENHPLDLECTSNSLLILNHKKFWPKLKKYLDTYEHHHLKALSLFSTLCKSLRTDKELKSLIPYYARYRDQFTDSQFLQQWVISLETHELMEFIKARQSYGYSLGAIYRECANIFGGKISPDIDKCLQQIDLHLEEGALTKMLKDLQRLLSFIESDFKEMETAFLKGAHLITDQWDASITRIQEQELAFLLALPLLVIVRNAENECIAEPSAHIVRIARIYHSPLARPRFIDYVLDLLFEELNGHLPQIPAALDKEGDRAKDALWKLAIGFEGDLDYSWSKTLPNAWNYKLSWVVPELIKIYKKRFNHCVSSSKHRELDDALHLFRLKPDTEIIDLLIKHFQFLVNQHFNSYFEFIEHVPDQQFLGLLSTHYRDGEREIHQLIELLCHIHQQPSPFDENQHASHSKPSVGASVRILCPNCQTSYHYQLSVIYFDKEAIEQRQPFAKKDLWTTDSIECKNCHAALVLETDNAYRSALYAEVLTMQLLKLTDEEQGALELFKPLVFPRYFGKKTNPGVFIQKVNADLRNKRFDAQRKNALLLELGRLYMAINQLDHALASFQECIQLVSNQPSVLFSLGLIAFQQKNMYDARLYFSRVVSLYREAPPELEHEEEQSPLEMAQQYLAILDQRDFRRSTFKIIHS